MYSIFTAIAALVVAFVATSVTISPAPAQETASVSNIPPMYEVNWGSNEPLSPEADHALHTFYVCEYTPRGHAAMEDILNTLGTLSFDNEDSERRTRAETMYGLAKKYEKEGVCRWSDHQGYVSGSLHSTAEYDLSEVPCTTLPNGICAYIQPMKSKWEDEVVYSLFTDTDDEIIWKEIFGGEQWALIN